MLVVIIYRFEKSLLSFAKSSTILYLTCALHLIFPMITKKYKSILIWVTVSNIKTMRVGKFLNKFSTTPPSATERQQNFDICTNLQQKNYIINIIHQAYVQVPSLENSVYHLSRQLNGNKTLTLIPYTTFNKEKT